MLVIAFAQTVELRHNLVCNSCAGGRGDERLEGAGWERVPCLERQAGHGLDHTASPPLPPAWTVGDGLTVQRSYNAQPSVDASPCQSSPGGHSSGDPAAISCEPR